MKLLSLEAHRGVMRVREVLKRFNTLVYTGDPLDDIVLMDLELDDLYENKTVDDEEFRDLKIALRRAYRELDTDEN
ncbi:YqgQ family protein [Tumebacillus permanentifrigoris]|uniref:Uncharacterized protein YqgQ n=1 Tax=Tumebacillus permanentifrigoris TaxID=378543 RepID=A0A316D6A4_9BACL|nr:YqgQ family protein [Tumebacillus permanentifrigoris]PWK10256.1 uncharacterized protein YqgQ [Tumebacillus permanentifrigoris]